MIGSVAQDGMELIYSPPRDKEKSRQMYETMFFKTLDIRPWMTLMVVRWKQTRWEVWLKWISRPWCREGEPGQSLEGSLSWGDGAETLERPKSLVFPGQSTGGENSGDLLSTAWCRHVSKTTWGQEKNHLRGLEGTVASTQTGPGVVPGTHMGPGTVPVSHLPVWKTSYFKRDWVDYSERSCLSRGE